MALIIEQPAQSAAGAVKDTQSHFADSRRRAVRDYHWLLILLAAALAYFPLVSRWGSTDTDGAKIAWALVRGMQTGQHTEIETYVYGRAKNAGYYALFFALYPRSLSLEHIEYAMNWLNAVSGVATALLWYGIARRLGGRTAGLVCGLVFVFVPILWDLSGYGHPLGPCLTLLFAGWLVFLRAMDLRGALRFAAAIAAIGLLALSAWVRGEALLGFPALVGSALLTAKSGRMIRDGALATIAVLLAVAVNVALNSATQTRAPVQEGDGQSVVYAISYWLRTAEFVAIPKGFVYWAIGLGPLLAICAVGGAGWLLYLRRYRELLFALSALLPAAIFFLPDPERPRHFAMTVPGILVFALYPLWQLPVHRGLVAASLFIAGNYLSSMVVYPLVASRYAWHYANHYGSPQSLEVPLGGMIERRMKANNLLHEIHRQARALTRVQSPPLLFVGDRTVIRIAYYLATDFPDAEWSVEYVGVVPFTRVKTRENEFVFVLRDYHELRDALREASKKGMFGGFAYCEPQADEIARRPFELPAGRAVFDNTSHIRAHNASGEPD